MNQKKWLIPTFFPWPKIHGEREKKGIFLPAPTRHSEHDIAQSGPALVFQCHRDCLPILGYLSRFVLRLSRLCMRRRVRPVRPVNCSRSVTDVCGAIVTCRMALWKKQQWQNTHNKRTHIKENLFLSTTFVNNRCYYLNTYEPIKWVGEKKICATKQKISVTATRSPCTVGRLLPLHYA